MQNQTTSKDWKTDPRWAQIYLFMRSRAKVECTGACGEIVTADDIDRIAAGKAVRYLEAH